MQCVKPRSTLFISGVLVMHIPECRRLRLAVGAIALCAMVASPAGATGETRSHRTATSADSILWSTVFRMIGLKWPEVPQLETAELARRIEAHEPVLLIDTRAKDEYLVSHLPGAVWAESPAQLRAAVLNAPATQLIVLYCSVGVRSSKAAAILMREGGHTVANLRGSIFQWANEGRALEADGRPAVRVHPYNRIWGQLLEPRLRATGGP
jgi:rhodanese-related sulfurtransferase